MTPDTRKLFANLCFETSFLLGRAGFEPTANQIAMCRPGHRCHKSGCPFCSWCKNLTIEGHSQIAIATAATDYEAAIVRPLSIFAFTITPRLHPPISGLRGKADKLAAKIAESVKNRRKHVPGHLMIFETKPSEIDGEVLDSEHPHFHGVIGFNDESALALRGFRALPHFEKITNLQSSANWISYATKSHPQDFFSHWRSHLSVPDTFTERIHQLRHFQSMRSSGLFSSSTRRLILIPRPSADTIDL